MPKRKVSIDLTSDAPVKREDAGPTFSAAAEECVVCFVTYPQAEGEECPGGHFTCNGCIGMLCAQALERDPVAVTDVEKRQKSYLTCCANSTSACGQAFAVKSLARALSPERFEELGKRNVELGVHLALPHAVREHLEAAAAAGKTSSKDEIEKSIRSAYLRPDGSYRDETGRHVRQCVECGYGPIIAEVECGFMATHDQQMYGRYTQNNRCLHCGHLNLRHYDEWPRWTGEFVLGAVPSLVHAADADAPARVPAAGPAAPRPGRAPLRVGDRVRVRTGVDPPRYQWGSVRRGDEGTITRISGERCDVDFLRHRGWMGRVDEMERVGEPAAATAAPQGPAQSAISAEEDGLDEAGIECLEKVVGMGFAPETALLALRRTAHESGGGARLQATIDVLVA